MFNTLREKLDIVEVAQYVMDKPFRQIGDATFAPDDAECPLCGHNDCFRIKQQGEESFFKCFSCQETGDVTRLVAKLKDVTDKEAAKLLSSHYKIPLPNDYSPIQEIFDVAANYYRTAFLEAGPYKELGGLTPVEYQQQVRKHTDQGLNLFDIGWSDGGLSDYLESLGFAADIVKESGLLNKKGKDFLPQNCFIYPHKVRGRTSHFTFKDPLKKLAYQLPNKAKLNGHSFYNSDSVRQEGPVIVVEGENDTVSIVEAGWKSGVICCNGSISASQLEWMATNLAGRDVITIFDTDAAGDGYREKVGKLASKFKSLTQVKMADGLKDIDEYLKTGGDLQGAIDNNKVITDSMSPIEVEGSNASDIVVKAGAYYRVKYKEGQEFHTKLTNFTIDLRNIYIRDTEREREIIITREDGRKSSPLSINSDAKVSLKPFKTLVANAIDASFYGKEEDLASMWEYVYANCDERIVHLPEMVGRLEEFHGWLFRDYFIADTGAIYRPDDDGVIWIVNHTVGLKPVSIVTNGKNNAGTDGIPTLKTDLTEEEQDELLGGFVRNYADNLGNAGDAITCIAWAWATIYSNIYWKETGFFPFLYYWGNKSKGKSTIIKWLMSILNVDGCCYTTVDQLNSGVSFNRKMSYYASLPMCIDEVRSDRTTVEWYGTFRSWYERTGKTIGVRDNFGVKDQPVRSTLIFGGQDQFTDPATRNRCIPIRVTAGGRELVKTYQWFLNKSMDLRGIGYYWLKNYGKISDSTLIREYKNFDTVMRNAGIEGRTSKNWAMVVPFALRLTERYMPEFNYMEYLFAAVKQDVQEQAEDDTLMQFWEVIEGMQSSERALINSDHLKRDEDKLYVWFGEVYRLFEKDSNASIRERFTRRASLGMLREESYFIEETRHKMGVNENMRRVVVIDLTKAPEVVQNIANCLG